MISRLNSETMLKRFYKLYDHEKWLEARRVLFALLDQDPTNHWLLSRISSTFYEQRNHRRALTYARRAVQIKPQCPLALMDYAASLDMLGKTEEAISIWKLLLKRGYRSIAYGECGEGVRWAKEIASSCRYRIGLGHKRLGENRLALKYLKLHLKHRQRGIPDLYSRKHVQNEIMIIESM